MEFFNFLQKKKASKEITYTDDKFYIIPGQNKKPIVTQQLIDFFNSRKNQEGFLYTGYPLIGTAEGAFAIDAMLISKQHGLIAFDIIEYKDLGDYKKRQDDIYNKIQSYLLQYSELVLRRNLVVTPYVITIAPQIHSISLGKNKDDYPLITNLQDLEKLLDNMTWNKSEYYEKLHSIIQSITNIRNNSFKRDLKNPNSRGSILKKLEDSIANLDHRQAEAVIRTYDGVQRIRGLAGSGKTIVLALKVAYLHSQNPDWNIAVTFNTRSLKDQFVRLITRFVWDRKKDEPDWSKISILHAWGGSGNKLDKGIYYNICCQVGEQYLNFSEACCKFGYEHAFEGVCSTLLKNQKDNIKPYYDAILIDEAQDFPSNFLQLCYAYLKEPKRLIYAYDELQSLNGNTMDSPEVLFGSNKSGIPNVPQNKYDDIILYKCYRNSKPILATAHSFGFGIYRENGLIQMFDNKRLWEDVGYEITDGSLENNQHVILSRNNETSPEFLEDLQPKADLIVLKKFDNKEEQAQYLVEDIKNNLENEELLCSDIIVINTNPKTTQSEVAKARSLLYEQGINSNIAGISTSPDIFQEKDAITFTGIFRAKGNEAGLVYIINADECFDGNNVAKRRNILFTAITRSKAWVRILGCGDNMDKIIQEYKKIQEHNFTLDFIYPSEEKMKQMKIINREKDKNTEKSIQHVNQGIRSIIDALDSGEILVEDLNSEERERLKSLL